MSTYMYTPSPVTDGVRDVSLTTLFDHCIPPLEAPSDIGRYDITVGPYVENISLEGTLTSDVS